jgi:peptidoglycan/LPS O-acetylase OafA/YrhL
MTVEQPRKGNRFIAGDPLRGVVCLIIVIWHMIVASAQITGSGAPSPGLKSELGIAGPPVVTLSISVWFFFLLSGYLIAGPFVRAIVRGDGRRPPVGPYVRNRLLRIVPGYWFFLILTLVVVGTEGNTFLQTALFFVFGHVYDQGPFTERMVHAWTLDVEMVFYAAVPLLLVPAASLLRGRGTPWFRASLILGGLTIATVISLAMGVEGPRTGASVIPGSAWAFAPGVALATVEPLVRDRFAGARSGKTLTWVLVALGVGAFVVLTYWIGFDDRWLRNLLAGVSCTALVAAPLVWQWTTGGCWRVLDNPVLHWVGVRAYGIYLVHVLLIYELRFVIRDTGSTWNAILLVLPLILLIACIAGAVSYRFVEKPFLERKLPWRTAGGEPVPAVEAQPLQRPAPAPSEA